MVKYIKETILDGYYATGDYECFCFDKHLEPNEHNEFIDKLQQSVITCRNPDCSAPNKEYDPEDPDWKMYDVHSEQHHPFIDDDICRVYPNRLIPNINENDSSYNKKGKWTILITFEPYED